MRNHLSLMLIGWLGLGIAFSSSQKLTPVNLGKLHQYPQGSSSSVESQCVDPNSNQSIQPQTLSTEEKEKVAFQNFQEGIKLVKKNKAEYLKAAIEKFKVAQKLFNETENRFQEAAIFIVMGNTFVSLGEQQKALARILHEKKGKISIIL